MAEGKKAGARTSAKNTGKNGTSAKGQTRRSGKPVKSDKRVIDEIYAILFLALGSFFVIAMHTQMAGALGEGLQYGLKGVFGLIAYGFSYALIAYGLMVFLKKAAHINGRTLTLFIVLILCAATINAARFLGEIDQETFKLSVDFVKESFAQGAVLTGGGVAGMLIGLGLQKIFGMAGLYIICLSAGLVCILLLSNTPISRSLDAMKEKRLQRRLEREAEWEAEEEEIALQRQRQQSSQIETQQDDASSKIMRKKKIMEYMTDEDLFKEGQTSEEHMKEVEEKFNAAVKRKDGKKDTKGFKLSEATKTFIFGKKPHITQEIPTPAPPMGLEDKDPYIQGVFAEVESESGEAHSQEVDQLGTLVLEESEVADFFGAGEGLPEISSVPEISAGSSVQSEPYVLKEPEPAKVTEDIPVQGKAEELPCKNEASSGHSDGSVKKPYVFPPLDLLNKAKVTGSKDVLDAGVKTVLLEQTFKDFGVNAKILNVSKGPTVTRYEIQPGTGVKVSSIVRLSDDIALKLEAKSIRMEAPIPGKAAVGIEIENEKVQPVMFREVVESAAFKKHPSRISFAVGKDILGNAVIGDMAEMPHMLIAGSTGSGKSVCINSIISSFLYKASPDEVKLVLIDPKVVELSVYNGIPHLLVPVVTDPNKAAAALNWAVQEMDERYRKFAQTGVRKLADFNEKAKAAEEETMPQIVIVIDELADLMMVASSAVETAICRLAQKARAAGMHLIVATQRPSVDVITGVIKANIPSRIAFAVSSQIDSRTILDMAGAEKLVGKGDMLFNPLGKAKPTRVQGTFITDGEVESVIAHVKAQVAEEEPQSYSNDLAQAIETSKISAGSEDGGDELLAEAIEFVVNAEQASVSMLQRRMRIGYNRAARLIDMMEERGIVGPADGSRPRTVLMSKEELENLNEMGDMEYNIK